MRQPLCRLGEQQQRLQGKQGIRAEEKVKSHEQDQRQNAGDPRSHLLARSSLLLQQSARFTRRNLVHPQCQATFVCQKKREIRRQSLAWLQRLVQIVSFVVSTTTTTTAAAATTTATDLQNTKFVQHELSTKFQ